MNHPLLRRVVDVRPGEGAALLWAFVYFFCLLSSYYILRPLRDEMGVAAGVANLQWLFTATFFVMLAAMPVFGALVARLPRRRFIPWVYRFFVLCIVVFYALLQLDAWKANVARAFFVWVSVFNLFVVTVFWGFLADVFSYEQGKRLFGFIGAEDRQCFLVFHHLGNTCRQTRDGPHEIDHAGRDRTARHHRIFGMDGVLHEHHAAGFLHRPHALRPQALQKQIRTGP